MQRVV